LPGTRQASVSDASTKCFDLVSIQFDAAPTRHVARHGETQELGTHQATHIDADGGQRRAEVACTGTTRGDVDPRIRTLARIGATLQHFEGRVSSRRRRREAR